MKSSDPSRLRLDWLPLAETIKLYILASRIFTSRPRGIARNAAHSAARRRRSAPRCGVSRPGLGPSVPSLGLARPSPPWRSGSRWPSRSRRASSTAAAPRSFLCRPVCIADCGVPRNAVESATRSLAEYPALRRIPPRCWVFRPPPGTAVWGMPAGGFAAPRTLHCATHCAQNALHGADPLCASLSGAASWDLNSARVWPSAALENPYR